MFSKALVATDLSEMSDRVIPALKGLRSIGTKEMLLLHCMNMRDVGPFAERLMQLATPALKRQKTMLEQAGFQVEDKIALGLPEIEINRQAVEHQCSLIALGSTGTSMSDEIRLGGVANAVLHSATRPVLLVRLHVQGKDVVSTPEAWSCRCLDHVLFPTDFSDNAERAFEYVRHLARAGAKTITLLHVQDRTKIDPHLKDRLEEFNRVDRERMERLKKELAEDGASQVQIEIVYGLPKAEIIARARPPVSLVVLGSQGRGFLAELFLGSVSLAVLRHAETPVLVVPALQS